MTRRERKAAAYRAMTNARIAEGERRLAEAEERMREESGTNVD